MIYIDEKADWLEGFVLLPDDGEATYTSIPTPHDPELVQRRNASIRKAWSCPARITMQRATSKRGRAEESDESKQQRNTRLRESLKAYLATPNATETRSKTMKKNWDANDERRKAQSERSKAYWANRRAMKEAEINKAIQLKEQHGSL